MQKSQPLAANPSDLEADGFPYLRYLAVSHLHDNRGGLNPPIAQIAPSVSGDQVQPIHASGILLHLVLVGQLTRYITREKRHR